MSGARQLRNAANYRAQKRRRQRRKIEIVAALGGRCVDCGYGAFLGALELQHRDPSEKEFTVGGFIGSARRLNDEVLKCDLVCANCHRERHLRERSGAKAHAVVAHRQRRKATAVAHMGGACHGCGRRGPSAIFEFHHLDPATKDFGISEDGNTRSWPRIVAELAKCVMLCANCHREVHAGVRDLDDGHLGLAEDALPYAA